MKFTVKKLIQYLEKFHPDLQIIIQKDGEGNSFSPLAGLDECVYVPETSYSGGLIHPEDYDSYDNAEDVVVLWPVS